MTRLYDAGMSLNTKIAEALTEMGRLHELLGADPFRVRAYLKAARAFEGLTADAAGMSRTELLALDGVGHKIVDKVEELVETGTVAELDGLRAKTPDGLGEVLRLQGVGPKTVRTLWKKAGVECLADLATAIDAGKLEGIEGMGAKTIENLARAIDFAKSAGDRTLLGIATPLAEMILEDLRAVKGVRRIEAAGSLRRGKETIGDLDFLAVCDDAAALRDAFTAMTGVTEVLASGETKTSVRLKAPEIKGLRTSAVQVDLRIVPEASWGAALLYFTGSKEHNIRLRERAQKRKLTLNEYGLFPDDGKKGSPQSRGVKAEASATEEAIYESLGLPWIPPEIREDRGEFGVTETPRLIEAAEVRAELHAHTTASDGALSIEELAEAAKARGFHTIAVTDHSKSQPVAHGLSEERLRRHLESIRDADAAVNGISILAGSEVDILADGSLDYDDELLAELDVVVASPHWALQQKPAKATARLLKAIEHPLVHVIGHPTGRLINRRGGLEPAMEEIIAAAVQHGTALEINAHWRRLDLRDHHVRAAVEGGALIAMNCDVHGPGDFDNLRYGVITGRRGWLTAERCVNTWTKAKLHKWLKAKRAGTGAATR